MIAQYESIARLLQAKRAEYKLNQRDVAKAVHSSHRTVTGWEAGDRIPHAAMAYGLADFYGLSDDDKAKFMAACAGAMAHSRATKVVDEYIAVAKEHGLKICSRQGG